MARPTQTLDVHIGSQSPTEWDRIDEIRADGNPNALGRRTRPPITQEKIEWGAFGLTPRWVGDDSSEAVAALEPSHYVASGAQEWRRMVAGANARGELLLAVSMIGSDLAPEVTSVFGSGTSVWLPHATMTSVGGKRIALASRPELAPGLQPADRDLALRIAYTRPTQLPWWTLKLSGSTTESVYGQERHEPVGELRPLLISRAGEPVAGVWISPDGRVRHWVLPFMPSWAPILAWISGHAIGEFVPSASRRVRSSLAGERALQTVAETETANAVAALDADYAAARATLVAASHAATVAADALRQPLLYGTGSELVAAVATVLTDAGMTVHDLDTFLGSTASADLLAEYGGYRVLVEVKSSSGAAGERLAEAPARHLATWPQVAPDIAVAGVVLVVAHQTGIHPLDRDDAPFRRPEFVSSLTVPVVTAVQLWHWWRTDDRAAVRAAVLGEPGDSEPAQAPSAPVTPSRPAVVSAPTDLPKRSMRPGRGLWRRARPTGG